MRNFKNFKKKKKNNLIKTNNNYFKITPSKKILGVFLCLLKVVYKYLLNIFQNNFNSFIDTNF